MDYLERLEILFDDEDGNGDGGGTSTPDDDGAPDDGNDGGGGANNAPTKPTEQDKDDVITRDAFEKEREEKRKLAERLEELERKEKEREEAQLSEQEKLERERDEYKQKLERQQRELEERSKRDALMDHALEEGLKKPNRSLSLVDTGSLVLDDDGNVRGAEQAILDLKDEMPHLFDDGTQGPPNTGGGGSGDGSGSDDTKATAGDEPESDYEKGAGLMRSAADKKGRI
ncbi:MAG: hypothetical protein U5L04_01745 [Trueperaceae bacterium]|nr:hypothetical protein [Trueperaceae bacterium]